MMLDLTEEENDALAKLLSRTIDDYPFSSRIQSLKAILAKLKPEPVREPLSPPKVYAPPRATRARRSRGGRMIETRIPLRSMPMKSDPGPPKTLGKRRNASRLVARFVPSADALGLLYKGH
jgi:hypothetical protein